MCESGEASCIFRKTWGKHTPGEIFNAGNAKDKLFTIILQLAKPVEAG